jgi:3-isopropylmalate/(R)-2-methylmalate dehydratase small subunit
MFDVWPWIIADGGRSMKPFTVLTAVAVPLKIDKIDTGMILPGRFMRQHRRPGHDYATAFLHDLRFDEKEVPREDCALNKDVYRNGEIMVVGADFGCGSSREGAAYAVMDYGLRALIAPSFGEIFYSNCLQNGILPVDLPRTVIEDLWRQIERQPGCEVTIDLAEQKLVAPDHCIHDFDINPTRKDRLLHGLDDIDVTLQHGDAIARYESERRSRNFWLTRDDAVKSASD